MKQYTVVATLSNEQYGIQGITFRNSCETLSEVFSSIRRFAKYTYDVTRIKITTENI